MPDLARRHRVVTWDARGNGRSDRPRDPAAHSDGALARDLLAVLDASGTDAAILVGLSGAAVPAIMVATEHPDRVLGLVLNRVPAKEGQRYGGYSYEAPAGSATRRERRRADRTADRVR